MSDINPQWKYITLEEMRHAKHMKRNATTVKDKGFVFQNLSKHDIPNVLTHKDLPLLDEIHVAYWMTPP